jgi:hypothetical protein
MDLSHPMDLQRDRRQLDSIPSISRLGRPRLGVLRLSCTLTD